MGKAFQPASEAGILAAACGCGPALSRVLELFNSPDLASAFPWLRLAGVVPSRPGQERDLGADMGLRMARIQVFSDLDALFARCPGVNLVFDVAGDLGASLALREALPAHISIVDERTTLMLWELLLSGSICAPVKSTLFRAKAFLSTLLDGLEDDVLLLDPTGRIIDVNRMVCARLGRNRESLVGLHCRELEGGDFCRRARRECPFQETLVSGKKAEAIHTKLDADGRLLYFRMYTYPLFDEFGKLSHVVEMRRDITARTYTEQRLQQAQKMAAIGELSTYIAHEIRNPLFAIGGFAGALLRRTDLDAEAREKISIILEESRRLDAILRSILNYARPTDARAEDLDVNLVAGETVQLMTLGCEPEGICLRLELGEGLARAKGVPELLKQCLINMIKNSMEAMAGEGGAITVSTGMSDAMVYVRVRDEGAGIPDEVKIKVFNPFFSTKDKGSGLGLAMTRKIVEEVGGTVRLESEVGKGTTVTVYLPPSLAVDADTLDGAGAPG